MLDLVLIETPQEDRDFDLDVRLQPVQHPFSAETTKIDCGSMIGCPTSASNCDDYRPQD